MRKSKYRTALQSKKTGKFVGESYRKRWPHLVKKVKVPRKTK